MTPAIRALDRRLGVLNARLGYLGGPRFPGTPEYEAYQRVAAEARDVSARMVVLATEVRMEDQGKIRQRIRYGPPRRGFRSLAGTPRAT